MFSYRWPQLCYIALRSYTIQVTGYDTGSIYTLKACQVRHASLITVFRRLESFQREQVPLAIYVMLSPELANNRIYSTSSCSFWLTTTSAGYFLYDLYVCVFRFEGAAYLMHGLFCFVLYTYTAMSGFLHYYGELNNLHMQAKSFSYMCVHHGTKPVTFDDRQNKVELHASHRYLLTTGAPLLSRRNLHRSPGQFTALAAYSGWTQFLQQSGHITFSGPQAFSAVARFWMHHNVCPRVQ